MVLKPEKEDEAEAIFRKWGLDFAIVGQTTPTKRFIVKHGGEVMADLPIKELGDEAPVYDRPHVETPKQPVIDAAERDAADDDRRCAGEADRLARPLLQALGLGAVRPRHPRQHRAAAGRRRRRGARRRRAEGAGAHRRRDAALLRGRSVRGRQAGGGGSLAQHHRGRRRAARDHRQPQLRQSGAAGDHGPVRRLHPRHRRGLPGARLPGRVRQRLALQRDQRPRRSCRPRPSAASACSTISRSRRRSPSRPRARRSC